ncbi:TM2 domain-containing membrane protein YozV [Luteibacter sp. Sphag1AF]|uniref:TM2 domain-containing protein n=1 Tax=Luteibacter sp. Sphag1AF TaxID=2587031 RepID=UPI0016081123|nr:TM2 domain-containing protein [Luteibacter sp. Sphag1AF]MBB3227123.1 TM2 domain-containing membrane protein YozV [Luteibacter sp. Sphag1AF]
MALVYCRECGKQVSDSASSCPGCGAAVAVTGTKSHIAAGVLALVVGGLGVHKFYLGRTGQGILYLIFCWTFIPSLISFIEGIIYLCTNERDFQAKYG